MSALVLVCGVQAFFCGVVTIALERRAKRDPTAYAVGFLLCSCGSVLVFLFQCHNFR